MCFTIVDSVRLAMNTDCISDPLDLSRLRHHVEVARQDVPALHHKRARPDHDEAAFGTNEIRKQSAKVKPGFR
jgi:hypothetical protein